MSLQSPVGTLDIKNATLRVGKLEVSNIQGVDTALNVTRANSVLIYDDQVSTTTFNGFTSSGVRDTGNGYLDVADGYVYWGQKLPNSWVMDFEMDIRSGTNPGPLYANVFSTTNTGGDGYSFTFNDSNDKISLYYDSTLLTETTVSGLFTASEDWQKVVINYERGLIVISLDGSRKFYYKDIERETPYVNGEYVSFSSASTDGRKIRDLRVVNGEKWIYSGESNVVYTQGSVGIGVTDPTVALDVSGTVKATAFDGDGSAITNISSANVGDFESNVTRITNLETNRALKTDLDDNSSRISTISDDLSDNSSRITALETGDINISGEKTFTGEVIFESNLRVQGDLLVANTVNMTVYDPILELGSNNLNTGDVGLVMTRHGDSNSNVAIFFDETADTLKLGYTLNGANDTTLELDSNALAVSVQGALTVGSNLEVGTANLFVDTTTSNVGVGTDAPAYKLDVHGSANVGAITMNSNVYAPNLPLADTASNLVTWNSATGDLMDSGGLISNKLAIVSEQPPAALTGDSTVVDGHGRYKVTRSSVFNAYEGYNIFSKIETDTWLSATDTYNSDGTYAASDSLGGISGEWVKLEMPYKTTLRHFTLRQDIDNTNIGQRRQFPVDFKVIASNDDTNWTTINTTTGVSTPAANDPALTVVVNANTSYKYYAIVVEKISAEANSNRCQIGEWRLFTETFTVDAGVVSTTAASGLDVGYTEHPVVPLTGSTTYNANIGTTGEFPPSTHYVEGHGTYEAWASTQYNVSGQATREVWKLFDGSTSTYFQQSSSTGYDNYNGSSPYEYVGTRGTTTTDVGGTRYMGVWVQLKLPYTIKLAYTKINNWTSNTDRSPGAGVILGSNDGDNWYKLTEFSGLTYTSNEEIVQVNATTPYQYYRMVATNTVGSGSINFTEWRLFAEKPVTRMENVHISGELSSETLQTGYIKWPRKSLKANESEGYVASASTQFPSGTSYYAWHAFEDKGEYSNDVGSYPAWLANDGFASGVANVSRTTGTDTFNHEWLQIQMPIAICLSHFTFSRRQNPGEMPKSGRMYGSNDGVSWTKLVSFSNNTETNVRRIDVKSDTRYSYFRFTITEVQSGSKACVDELQLFEAATGVGAAPTSAKLQVAGSLGMAKGSEFFAGDDVVMELPKHDRPLVKYPEVAMTANSSGGYVASANSTYPGVSYEPYSGFNNIYTTDGDGWEPVGGAQYSTSTGAWIGGTGGNTEMTLTSGTTIYGQWLQLQMPQKIKLSYVDFAPKVVNGGIYDDLGIHRSPAAGYILGSNDGTSWTSLTNWTGYSSSQFTEGQFTRFNVNASVYYKYYRMVCTTTVGGTYGDYFTVQELEYYGHEEGDTSVDVVHRSIPNKPGQQHLAVYWDANDSNSYSFADSSNVYDLSGSGVTGAITGNNGFDAEYNAWVFDGSGDYISGTINTTTGAWVHSFSFWMNADTLGGSNAGHFVTLGAESTDQTSTIRFAGQDKFQWYFWGNDLRFDAPGTVGNWVHVVGTYDGGNDSGVSVGNFGVSRKIFINTKETTVTENVSGTAGSNTLNLTTTSTPFRIGSQLSGGAGFDGKIANVRVFSKKLSIEQIRELYEYDAPRFGHRQNLVALHKGNLGVGVAHPTSRFEVAGADGLQEYPPKAMTGFETYMEGHGVFKVHKSGDNTYIGVWPAWEAFNEVFTDAYHGGNFYTGTDYAYAGTETLGGISGDYVILELPYKIKAKQISLAPYPTIDRTPEDFTILGSNDNVNWTKLATFNGITNWTSGVYKSFNINSDEYFNHFAVVVTRLVADQYFMISEIKYYGTPAPSAIEDGHLTLGKALTLPRVSGHAAGAETPRAESLVVHYDTTVDSVVSGTTVVDISGEGNNGSFNGNATYSSTDRAFTFDGTGDYILKSSPSGLPTGDAIYSMSAWVNINSSIGTLGQVITFGSAWATSTLASIYIKDGNQLGADIGGNQVYTTNALLSSSTWHHIAIAKKSTGQISTSMFDMYVDGTLIAAKTSAGTGTQNLGTAVGVSVGMGFNGGNDPFNGKISNPKLWNVVLTAEEVAAEYALGRTGKSINLTDTSLCLGGTVPRAQLDVRGSAYINGIVGTGPTDGIIIPYGTTAQQPTGVTGMLRFNTSLGKLQVYDGTNWVTIGYTTATGGTVTYAGGYTIHTFTTSGTFTVYSAGDIELLVVAGGGGGGSGGGGAGGMITASKSVTTGTYAITVGPGGTGGGGGSSGGKTNPTSGGNSVALGYTAIGGGYGGGGSIAGRLGATGGSGGGHGYDINTATRSIGTSGQGNGGGRASVGGLGGAGGGGGAGGAGNDGNEIYGGNGGIGAQSSITGTATYYAGGGGGGLNQNDNVTYARPSGQTYGGFGGQGGGGTGTTYGYASGGTTVYASPGTDNTGGGGGGTDPELDTGGDGGDGIVIIRYLT
jgi:hypothetical protein